MRRADRSIHVSIGELFFEEAFCIDDRSRAHPGERLVRLDVRKLRPLRTYDERVGRSGGIERTPAQPDRRRQFVRQYAQRGVVGLDSSAFFGKPYATYKLDDFVRFTTMEEDLREYVKEDNIIKTRGNFHIKVLSDRGFLDAGDPLVLVDGIPVFNINKIFGV